MTPKEQYEARKALRSRLPNESYQEKKERDEQEVFMLVERFVAAVESIAASLARPSNQPAEPDRGT